jgi:hypothetical protein
MAERGSIPENLKLTLDNGVLRRLPVTFLPFVNQQLREWDFLFPNERQSVEHLLLYAASLSAEQSSALFRNVVELEVKMEVRKWNFSTTEQTIENASLLARSPYYQEWRSAVQSVFDSADRYAQTAGNAPATGNRLVILDIPRPLEMSASDPWRRWQNIGRPIEIDPSQIGESRGVLESLLTADSSENIPSSSSLIDKIASHSNSQTADVWVVDAGRSLIDVLVSESGASSTNAKPTLLSYARLDQYRQNFSREMNTMRKDLTDADAVYDRLRKVDVKPWCPPEASDPAIREYLRSLYLSGNGAVIFGNSFVQWGASEAFRRARPRFLAARFGVRSKPKPFTGVAVFDNPDLINPLPAADDLPGSAIDAQMLALYVWLAAARYSEYQGSTACICIAESLSQAYLIAPREFSVKAETARLSVEELRRALHDWMA